MTQRIDVTLHRHGRSPLTITPWVTKLTWTRSISAPWSSLTVVWKTTVRDAFSLVAVGDWVVVRIPTATSRAAEDGTALTFCRIDSIQSGAAMNPGGKLTSGDTVLACSSWWNLLKHTNIYVPPGWTDDSGTLFNISSWGSMMGDFANQFINGSVGKALADLFRQIAAIKLPDSISKNKELGELIPVVHEAVTRDQYAPDRVVEPVTVNGAISSSWAGMYQTTETTVQELLNNGFVPEPMLIELFPSFEPFGDKPIIPDDQTNQDRTLAKFLGGWEVLLYRIKPFRTIPLKDSTEAQPDYKHRDVEELVERFSKFFENKNYDPEKLEELRTRAEKTNRARISGVLERLFTEKTWDYDKAKLIKRGSLRSVTFARTDTARVNASTIVLAPDPSSGITALKELGLPITYDEEIKRHGLRLLKPTWTFTIIKGNKDKAVSDENRMDQAANNTTDFTAYMRSIAAQLMQFYKNNHLYTSGTITANLLEATEYKKGTSGREFVDRVLYVKPGEILSLDMGDEIDPFFCYVETVSHGFVVSGGGVEAAKTEIAYSRGHFQLGAEVLDDVGVPIRLASGVSRQIGAPTDQLSLRSVPSSRRDRQTSKPIDDVGAYILVAGVKHDTEFNVIHSHLDTSNPSLPSSMVTRRDLSTVKLAILHYEGINIAATNAERVKNYFDRQYIGYAPGKAIGSVHFLIDYDGAVWQILDCSLVAAHAGPSPTQVAIDGVAVSPNPTSIGIGFINPVFLRKDIPPTASSKWPVTNDTWYTKSSKGTRGNTDFLLPTTAQLASCSRLLQTLPGAGVPVNLTTSADPTEEGARTWRRLTFKEKRALLTTGGVYHHLQWESQRFDAAGVDIRSLL